MPMINFIKGHMCENEIIGLLGDQIPRGREIEVALNALDPLNIRGDEAGLLYKGEGDTNITVKIGGGSRRFISMCGGLIQVLGKALIGTNLSEHLILSLKDQ